MKAIDFVVRDSAGALQRGVVPVESAETTVTLSSGLEISFNLRQMDLAAQRREGDDLIFTLADGREVRLENYFNDAGVPNRLFVSADGYLNEVAFVETTEGTLFAQYGPTEAWGKWSPSDDLIYLGGTEIAGVGAEEEVSMLAPALLGGLGGAGAAGAAALGSAALLTGLGGGSDGGGATRVAPSVDDAEDGFDVGGDDPAGHTFEVTGTGQAGEAVRVSVGGVDVDTVIGDDGTWGATFEGETFPEDGAYEAVVVVTDGSGESETLDGPGFVIDTTPPELAVVSGTEAVGDLHNAAAFADGVTITGTGEAGAAVEATIDGVTQAGVVGEDGTWSLTWEAGTLADGEYTSGIAIVSRDSFGNSTTVTDMVVIDTVTTLSIDGNVEGDNIINAAEAVDGVTFTGQAQPGASVLVTFGAATTTVIAGAGGAWSAAFPASDIPTGETEVSLSAVATDAAGNTSSASSIVNVDTLVNALSYTSTSGGADGVINAAEAAEGLVVTGMVEPGSSVVVELNGVSVPATVASDGSWTARFAASDLAAGTYTATMVATATDAAGNTRVANQEVTVDTEASVLTIAGPVETDDIVNEVEASDGVVITGTADPGAVVDVTLAGVAAQVVTGADGTWSAAFAASDVAPGVYTAEITATTTDAAGNSNSATDSVEVDTRVDNLAITSNGSGGDDVISGAEQAGTVTIAGTTEPGSALMVTLGAATVAAQVDAAGNWTADFAASQIPVGEYETTITVEATDAAGNVASVSDTVAVDTLVNQLTQSDDAGADRTLSAAEALDGMALSGLVEPGSSVTVNFNGTDFAAAVDAAGNWALDIPPSAIPAGEYDATITVTATDAVGNTDSISDVVAIDTTAPDGPVVASFTRDADGIRGISTEQSAADLSVAQVSGETASDVAAIQTDIDVLGETNFAFTSDVPDGSNLIVNATDAVGNTTGTYVAMDDGSANSTVDLGVSALGNYQIEALDLQFAEEASLTIDEAQLVALSTNSDSLRIDGGSDDTVTISGATRSGSETIDGQTYDVYTLGAGTIVIDDDIQVGGIV